MKKKILIISVCLLLILSLSVGVYWHYHPTHFLYNDRFILGNTKENITVGVKGNDLNISFNSKYFSDCLRVIDNPYVKMNLNSAIQPCVITPCEGDDFVFLILPVKAR